MAVADLIKSQAAAMAAKMAVLRSRQNGASDEQMDCIEFFMEAYNPTKGCLKKKSEAMSMDEYCEYIDKTIADLNLKQKAIEKIGLDESQISEIEPLCLVHFNFKDADFVASQETRVKGVYRSVSNLYVVNWIFFSSTQIYTYTYEFDTTNNYSKVTTNDFFYSDITCIKTAHEVENVVIETSKGCGCLKKKKYVHNDKQWDYLQISVPGEYYKFGCTSSEVVEQSIQAAKAMVREKKNA